MSGEKESTIRIERSIHLGRKLGSGGMGRVVDGFSPDLGQHLAVKILHPEAADSREARERFQEEIAIMASIDHPGSLPIYGAATGPDGCPAYVMKKVEGQTLAQQLAQHRDNSNDLPRRAHLLGILLDVCETVAFAHQAGIIHRDLKPENILIDRHGSVYVVDWGLARRENPPGADSAITRTIAGTVMGSPGYLSPEQAEGKNKEAGPPSDVFSLGAVLYEILTGKRPFQSDNVREEMLGAVHKEQAAPHSVKLLVPRSISAVCMKALEKDSRKRYPTALELAADLTAFIEGRPVSAKRPSLAEKFYYASRTSPVRTTTVTACLVTVLAIIAFVGAQVYIDHQITEKITGELEVVDVDLAENREQWRDIRRKLLEPGLSIEQANALYHDLEALNARWVIDQMEAMRLLGSSQSLHFLKSDRRLENAWINRIFSFCEEAIELQFPALSHALATDILESIESGETRMSVSKSELSRLHGIREEALRLMTASSEEP